MKKEWERLEPMRIRIMSEAYDLADRGDSEGFNSVKVMCSDVLALIETEIATEREKVAQWMMDKGYATGHGDSIEDLVKEIEWQVAEREREACVKVCDEILEHTKKLGKEDAMLTAISCAVAILARGEK